jgi:hypothetical protein
MSGQISKYILLVVYSTRNIISIYRTFCIKASNYLQSHIKLYYETTHHKHWMFPTARMNKRALYNANRKNAYHDAFNSLLGRLMQGTSNAALVATQAREEEKTFDALVEKLLETEDDSSNEEADKDAFKSLLYTLME